jgi:hypothetical protein
MGSCRVREALTPWPPLPQAGEGGRRVEPPVGMIDLPERPEGDRRCSGGFHTLPWGAGCCSGEIFQPAAWGGAGGIGITFERSGNAP